MRMMERLVDVRFTVRVTTDDEKFTEDWMQSFRRVFYPSETVDEHAEHIAQLEARGILAPCFTEGYGPLADMGIKAETVDCWTDVISEDAIFPSAKEPTS